MVTDIDVSQLTAGRRFLTVEGNIAEVVLDSEDGRWVKVRYLQQAGIGSSELDLCSREDIAIVIPTENCTAIASNIEGESLYCVLPNGHAAQHVWRNAGCLHSEEDERAGRCEHDHAVAP